MEPIGQLGGILWSNCGAFSSHESQTILLI